MFQFQIMDSTNTLEMIKRLAVWVKGYPIPNFDPTVWRYDRFGTPMRYSDYGNTDSEYGWEIDHSYPSAMGGPDTLPNYQPLNWKNNRAKGARLV